MSIFRTAPYVPPVKVAPRPYKGRRRWSTEYCAYASSQKRTPAEQLEHDTKRWSGGKMCGFILWMSKALNAFKKAHPEALVGGAIIDQSAKIRFSPALFSNQQRQQIP